MGSSSAMRVAVALAAVLVAVVADSHEWWDSHSREDSLESIELFRGSSFNSFSSPQRRRSGNPWKSASSASSFRSPPRRNRWQDSASFESIEVWGRRSGGWAQPARPSWKQPQRANSNPWQKKQSHSHGRKASTPSWNQKPKTRSSNQRSSGTWSNAGVMWASQGHWGGGNNRQSKPKWGQQKTTPKWGANRNNSNQGSHWSRNNLNRNSGTKSSNSGRNKWNGRWW